MTLTRQHITSTVILAYIALLFLYIPLRGQFFAADFLAPVIAIMLLERRVLLALRRRPYPALLAFLAIAAISTLCHAISPSGDNGYNLAVFLYLAGLFVFVRENPPPRALLLPCGAILCGLILLAWLAELTAFIAGDRGSLGFAFISTQMDGTAMSFLARRFAFTFQNPNTLGSFYVLPVAMVLSGLAPRARHFTLRQWLLCLLGLGLCLLPLVHSFSKHAVLTGAVMLGFLADACRPRWPRLSRWSWLLIIAVGLICTATVLWVVFPLKPQWPVINTTSGMYMIHQNIYAKMATHTPRGFLIGHSPAEIARLYPQLADHNAIRNTLEHYNAVAVLDSFAAFMDPHQEYLNILSLFGAGALAAMIAFWISSGVKATTMARYFLLALAFCCLWDDLLSKRWLWLAAAILLQNNSDDKNEMPPAATTLPEA